MDGTYVVGNGGMILLLIMIPLIKITRMPVTFFHIGKLIGTMNKFLGSI